MLQQHREELPRTLVASSAFHEGSGEQRGYKNTNNSPLNDFNDEELLNNRRMSTPPAKPRLEE